MGSGNEKGTEKALLQMVGKGIRSWKDNGLRYTFSLVKQRIKRPILYYLVNHSPLFTKEELEKQKIERFPKRIKFSVVVPLYNTPVGLLKEMIGSVVNQTYADWELCMADASDSDHEDVQNICSSYSRKDSRIRYKKLEKNYGISANTNACLDMVVGDYIALLDHDDLLHPAALHEVMKAICEQNADFIYTDEALFRKKPKDSFCHNFKPDYAPDSLRGSNYICHLTVFQRKLLEDVGRFDPECDGSQDHDMILRLTEKASKIVHIPEILYYWRAHSGSVADDTTAKTYAFQAAIHSVEKQLERLGMKGEVSQVRPELAIYRIRYTISGTPKVSVLIPNYEHYEDLRNCLNSIFEKTTYPDYEIVIVENNSSSDRIFEYYKELQKNHSNLRVVQWNGKFNYSAINNYGVQFCKGEYILLLNNDTEVITPDWIQEMLMFAQRKDVGAVGAKLYYPDNTIQHAGVILGLGGVAGHCFQHADKENLGFMGRLIYAQNLSAVTAACLMIRKSVWDEIGGFNELLMIAFNDVDFCMRIRKAGYLIVWTPFSELYHYESKSRGQDDTSEKQRRFEEEVNRFKEYWSKELEAGDPYYNRNLTLDEPDFSLRAPKW